MAGLALLALVAFVLALSADWLLPDDPLGVVEASLGWHHEPPPPTDLPLESFLPSQIRAISAAQAIAENLASPLTLQNPPPPIFLANWLSPDDLGRATDCMASAIYYEAGGEPEIGQMAVAQVILNRLRHPRFPKSVCGVVYQGSERASGCQFTFSCDGSLRRPPDAAGLARARRIADLALHGGTSLLAGQATHCHAISIVPVWAREMRKVAIIGHHVFYRPPSAYGGYPAPALSAAGTVGASAAPSNAPQTNSAGANAAGPTPGMAATEPAAVASQQPVAIGHAVSGPEMARAPGGEGASAAGAGMAGADSHRGYFPSPRRRTGALPLPSVP